MFEVGDKLLYELMDSVLTLANNRVRLLLPILLVKLTIIQKGMFLVRFFLVGTTTKHMCKLTAYVS